MCRRVFRLRRAPTFLRACSSIYCLLSMIARKAKGVPPGGGDLGDYPSLPPPPWVPFTLQPTLARPLLPYSPTNLSPLTPWSKA
ncbi:hypothetical protein OF83DRAFT_859028 [Amylostereum chailletii]|nr:hypothetical protein OF83DRAFT_859028 [Amylostereum chailletii]